MVLRAGCFPRFFERASRNEFPVWPRQRAGLVAAWGFYPSCLSIRTASMATVSFHLDLFDLCVAFESLRSESRVFRLFFFFFFYILPLPSQMLGTPERPSESSEWEKPEKREKIDFSFMIETGRPPRRPQRMLVVCRSTQTSRRPVYGYRGLGHL